nr:MAG TPA: hypothetical protein [Bacteriophage sp.]
MLSSIQSFKTISTTSEFIAIQPSVSSLSKVKIIFSAILYKIFFAFSLHAIFVS